MTKKRINRLIGYGILVFVVGLFAGQFWMLHLQLLIPIGTLMTFTGVFFFFKSTNMTDEFRKGQLQKGGVDPVKVVHDFLPLVRHVHMKDWDGGPNYLGYCPLGEGKVNVKGLVDMLDKSGNDLMIMVELDPSDDMPLAPLESARISKAYLQKLGYTFRS
jgi:hypothetical protein